jgi:hypothetical protein
MLGRTLVGEFLASNAQLDPLPPPFPEYEFGSRHVPKRRWSACRRRQVLPECWRPLFCMSLDLLDSQKLTNFLHNEVIWMFEAVLFKVVDTL